MITAVIANWSGLDIDKPPVPEAVLHDVVGMPFYYTVDIEDLAAFIKKHGAMIISPPGKSPYSEGWFIWYNHGSSRFTQS